MTLLQPGDTPSRMGINNAITSEIAAHADESITTADHYDSGWLNLPGTPAAIFTFTVRQYRIRNGTVQIRFAGTMTNITVPTTGNIGDQHIGDLPAGARPGGGGIASSSVVPVEINQWVAYAYIYNGGSVNLAYADARNADYTLGGNISCISPTYSINS